MKTQILIADRFAQNSQSRLSGNSQFQVKTCATLRSPQPEELEQAHALIIRSGVQINSKLIRLAPHLKYIITCTSGFDHIDLKATQEAGITVAYTPNAHIYSTSELTLTMILNCLRRTLNAHRSVKEGSWKRDHLIGQELYGKICGIIGLGRIGGQVAKLLKAFGAQVVAFDPFIDESRFQELGCERMGYEELLQYVDILTFHVPLTSDTKEMLHRGTLELMQRGSIVINCCRGSVICEDDLIHALETGKISAAGLDVFEKEPIDRNSKILKLSNVVFSPHIGALTEAAFNRASEEAADKIIAYFTQNTPLDTLPPQALWYHNRFYHNSAQQNS